MIYRTNDRADVESDEVRIAREARTRDVAALLRELADALEEDDDATPTAEAPPRAKRRRAERAPNWPAPLHEPDDLSRQRAARMLRRRGVTT